jgi:hypothetical protein
MAQNLAIVPCTAALVALLQQFLADKYDEPVDVKEIGRGDFNDQGELVLKKVAVRVVFADAAFTEARDISLTTLGTALRYQVVCRHDSLRSREEKRNLALNLTGCVLEYLGGARLALPDGSLAGPILLRGVGPAIDIVGPVEDCYAITLEISGFSQFPGTYARPQQPAVVA